MPTWMIVLRRLYYNTSSRLQGILYTRRVTMDIVFIHDLCIETTIGIFDWERQIKQTVIIDLDIASDIKRAAETDLIENALDYKTVSKRIVSFVESSQFQLVETLAERISTILLEEFHVPWVRIRVNKQGAIRGAKDVGVIIERDALWSRPI
ncbi:7,8-dihydroneopterin aldolase/epimerase/oxygenase [Gammaproteobacteria bacterium]